MIIVTAGESERRLGALLYKGCADKLSVFCVNTAESAFSGCGADIVFVSGAKVSRITCENAVVVLREGGCIPQELVCTNAIAIVESSNPDGMGQVAAKHLRAVTCGLATSDTFTLSSLTSDSAVVSLQRTIVAFDGTMIDPFELPVCFSGRTEPFSLLACAAIFCMMGANNPLADIKTWTILPC